ncbi:glycoside hydrolase family 25 protein [Nitratireductor aestuarii]|nr:GH25 family lysozyme [Nitratireductor aestuarii]
MRFSGKTAILLLCVATLTGCSSRGMSVEELMTQLSYETTASVAPSAAAAPASAAAPSSSEELPALAIAPTEAPVQMAALVTPTPRQASPHRGKQKIYAQKFRDAKPINFGKQHAPHRLPVHGVDVSRWQGNINWQDLREHGANFVYIKATDGGDHLDPMFRRNWLAASASGMRHGAYHFFYWCRTGAEQADWFIRNVPKEPGALPPVLDVEWNGQSQCKKRPSREQVIEKMRVFLDKLERHYGQRPIIYTAPDFYKDNLQGEFLDYPFWLRSVAAHPSKVYPGRPWVLWQYSGSGLSKGVGEKIDLNVFNGSERDWHNWIARNTH